jgi:hypothetical protein
MPLAPMSLLAMSSIPNVLRMARTEPAYSAFCMGVRFGLGKLLRSIAVYFVRACVLNAKLIQDVTAFCVHKGIAWLKQLSLGIICMLVRPTCDHASESISNQGLVGVSIWYNRTEWHSHASWPSYDRIQWLAGT